MAAAYNLLRLNAILYKEFIQMKRDYVTFIFLIIVPFFQAIFFGYVINTDPKNLPTALLASDYSTFTQSFIKGLENTGYFNFIQTVANENEADLLLKENKIQFIINIPANFTHDLVRGLHPHISLEADATDPVTVLSAYQAANKIVPTILDRNFNGILSSMQSHANSFVLDLQSKYNPNLLSKYHSLPGLIGIILTSVLISLTAVSMSKEYEQGTFESLLITPVKPVDLIFGKLIPHFIVAYTIYFLMIIINYWIFNIPFFGSFLLLTILAAPFIMATLAVGLVCSVLARSQFEAITYANFFILPSILLSGFTFPFNGMPKFAQYIGQILPTTHYIRICYGIMLKGSNFFQVWPDIWPILVFLVIVIGLCLYFYRETLD